MTQTKQGTSEGIYQDWVGGRGCTTSIGHLLCPIDGMPFTGSRSCRHELKDVRAFFETQAEQAAEALTSQTGPMYSGLIAYFPNACAYVAHVSKVGNEQHNKGEPMHWAFDKSIGKGDQILSHLSQQGTIDTDGLRHTGKVAWRALELLERELLAADPALTPGQNVKGFVGGSK